MATDANGLFVSWPLSNSFGGSSLYHWTGLDTDWTILIGPFFPLECDGIDCDCSDWTSNSNSIGGSIGKQNTTSSSAIYAGVLLGVDICDQTNRIICVEQ